MAATPTALDFADAKARPTFRPEHQTVKFTRVDELVYADATDAAPVLPEVVGKLAADKIVAAPTADSLAFDLFNVLDKTAPKPNPDGGDPLHRDLIERWTRTEDYQQTHLLTAGDETASALAAAAAVDAMARDIPEELRKRAEEARKAKEQAEEAAAYADMLRDDTETSPDAQTDADQAAADAQAAADQAADALAASLQSNGGKVQRAVAKAAAKAKDQAAGFRAACQSFGNETTAVGGGTPPALKMELARRVAASGDRFAKIAATIGRAVESAMRAQAAKAAADAGEIVDTMLGSEISELMEDEAASLVSARPHLRRLALARFADDAMLMHEVEQKEPLNRGGIVCLIDESGSMDGQREAEAKGVAIALAHVAARQRRRFSVHTFQTRVTWHGEITPTNARTPVDGGLTHGARVMLDLANRGTGGGTSFDEPLIAAARDVREHDGDKSDVLLITDGCASLSDKTVAEINALRSGSGVRVFVMLVGNEAAGATAVVAKVADRIWHADQLLKAGGPADALFAEV